MAGAAPGENMAFRFLLALVSRSAVNTAAAAALTGGGGAVSLDISAAVTAGVGCRQATVAASLASGGGGGAVLLETAAAVSAGLCCRQAAAGTGSVCCR